jgi:hypothetical protein
MFQYVHAHNPNFSIDIANAYYTIGQRYGIRGDIALCQAILETGWFRFSGGTAVEEQQYNYCGLGVLSNGMQGCLFTSITEGVTAHLQHLYAYATTAPLPKGEVTIDPRFNQVKRGSATTWESLSGRWAANDQYAVRILDLYQRMCSFDEADVLTIGIPDDIFDSLHD